MRTYRYVRDIIERVTTMDYSDYLLSPSQWRAKLVRYADSMDNHMRRAMQHPRFTSARDWLHTTVQMASLHASFIKYNSVTVTNCLYADVPYVITVSKWQWRSQDVSASVRKF